MPTVYDEECLAAGLDPKEVERIARGIERYGRQADKLGIEFFGGGICSMRFDDGSRLGKLIVAHLYGFSCDGGDGGNQPNSPDGLNRGEA